MTEKARNFGRPQPAAAAVGLHKETDRPAAAVNICLFLFYTRVVRFNSSVCEMRERERAGKKKKGGARGSRGGGGDGGKRKIIFHVIWRRRRRRRQKKEEKIQIQIKITSSRPQPGGPFR